MESHSAGEKCYAVEFIAYQKSSEIPVTSDDSTGIAIGCRLDGRVRGHSAAMRSRQQQEHQPDGGWNGLDK